MHAVRRNLADEGHGDVKLLGTPLVLDAQLLQALGLGEGRLEAVDTAGKVVLALVEGLVVLDDLEDLIAAAQVGLAVQKLGEAGRVEVGL